MTVTRQEDRDRPPPIRVLLIEDMDFEAEFTARQLKASGIAHVIHRVDTEEAMRSALAEFKPDIILSDFSLPRFDGLSALEIARECAPDVPFIFVSGTIGEERAIEALRRGAVDYVLKSNLARLAPAVHRALDEAAARAVRTRQELQIARLTGVLRMLSGINGVVVRIRDRKELLHEACRLAVTVGGYSTALVALKKPDSQALSPVAWSGCNAAAAAALCSRISAQAPESAAPDGRLIALPLSVDKTAIGVLAFHDEGTREAGEEELRMLREVAANLSFGLQYLQKDTRVRWLSYFDVLTGLANRTLFCERLGRRLHNAGAGHAIAIVDIENLSAINDSFGRHAGDLLLQLVADRLKRRFRDTDLLAHFAGGTFAVVQPASAASPQLPLEVLRTHIDSLFGEPFDLDGKAVPVAARTGVALYPDDGAEPDALVQRAEAALRNARTSGERYGLYCAERHSAVLARVALERRLRIALDRKQFELHYQPKVDVKTRRIEGVEALIRWNDPDSGLVSPAAFLPVLEATGLIVDVGDWVIERAALDCQEWQRMGLPPVRVAVNISSAQLNRPDFANRFLERNQGWTSESCGLDIEITESAVIDEASADMRKLKLLRAAGINIGIDDFGTGYSSLSRLAHLPIDTLKIDRSFIGQMSDPRGRKLVAIIISIARAFRMKVVAEGVETQDQLDALWQLGCDQSQGYLHSKPVSHDQLAELLAHGKGRFILPKERPSDADRPSAASGE